MKKLFCLVLVLSMVLTGCSGGGDTSDPGKENPENETAETKETIKFQEEEFKLGQDLRARNVYPNALPIEKGHASIRVLAGIKIDIYQLLIVDYEDNIEYKWHSDNPEIAECFGGSILGHKEGKARFTLSTRGGEEVITVDAEFYKDMSSRIVKTMLMDGSFYYPTITEVDNYLYIGTAEKITGPKSETNYFYKLDTDLNIIWKHEMGGLETRGGAVLDTAGNIYFVVNNRKQTSFAEANTVPQDENGLCWYVTTHLYSLTPEGKFRFSREISYKTIDQRYGMINCAISRDDTIYVADSRLYAFDTSGNVKWQFPKDEKEFMISRSSPVFDNEGNFYLPMSKYDPFNHHAEANGSAGNMVYDTALYSFAPDSNGTPRWSVAVENRVSMPPCSFNYDYSKIYLPLNQTVNCFNPDDGALFWKYSLNIEHGEFRANAAVDDVGNVYVGTKGDYASTLYAIKADGTGLLWEAVLGGDLYTSATLGDDGNIYITSETSYKGAFYSIDRHTGEILWTLPGTRDNYEGGGYPRLVNGYFYLNSGKYIVKIKADATKHLEKAGWATFRGSNAGTGARDD